MFTTFADVIISMNYHKYTVLATSLLIRDQRGVTQYVMMTSVAVVNS